MKTDILGVCIMEQFLRYRSVYNCLAGMQIWQLKLCFWKYKNRKNDYSLKIFQENHVKLSVYLEMLR